ncbi:MAG: hypothetical protein F4184_06930 [Gemmatimonadetes bacterium]|nr:hypothetical protein [Gemmatimonadota bacterium]
MAQQQGFFSLDEAVDKLGLSRPEIYRRVQDEALKGEKSDRCLRFAVEEIERYAAVLEQERDLLQKSIDRWLAFFAERLADYPWAVIEDVADKPVTEQMAELGERILQDALGEGAQDVYFDPLDAGLRLLYSVGRCQEVARFDACLTAPLETWLKGLAVLEEAVPERLGEGLIRKTWGETGCQLRVPEVPTTLGSHFHLHLFTDYEGTSLEDLGYMPEQAECLRREFGARPGLFLLIGSGVPEDERNRLVLARNWADAGRLVVCLDHRIRYRAEQLVQLELRDEAGPDFKTLWQAALDMSPDVVVLDEVRDADQAQALLEGVQSGTMVLVQVRAGNMIEAVQKLLDFEIDRAALGRALLGGVDKAVVRRLCPQCARRRPLRDDELARLGLAVGDGVGTPVGCSACGDGYVGRRSVYGLWLADTELAAWVADPQIDSPLPPIGPESLTEVLRRAVLDGEATPEEALALLP